MQENNQKNEIIPDDGSVDGSQGDLPIVREGKYVILRKGQK